tara:strand:+ start:3709 stop:4491 length:783 start_codon:yes stop_codon:yes gene_type:complete
MAIEIKYNPKELTKEFDKYQPKSLRFVSYRTVEFLGLKVREDVNKKYSKKGFFKDPVSLTLRSTVFKNYDGKAEVDIFPINDESKGNAPSKYLYPVIGGGNTDVYLTRFSQWLHRNNYMRRNQYAFPNKKYKEMVLTTGKNKRVIPNVYADTQRALRKTDARGLKYNSQGTKIQDARVFAVKNSFPPKSKKGKSNKYKPGIYRVSLKSGTKSGTFIKPLFFFDKKPKVKAKTQTFFDLVKQSSDKNVKKIFLRELKKYGR